MFAIPSLLLLILAILSHCFIIQEPDGHYFGNIMCDTSSSHLSFASNNNSPDIDIYAHKRRRLLDDNSDDNTLSNTCNMSDTLVYALSFLFLKTVNYTLFFWLSYYLHESFHISKSKSNMISCLYDVGGIIGSMLTGILLFRLKKYNIITVVMLLLSIIPLLFLKYTSVISYIDINIAILGYLLAGPSTIISTMVAVNLSKHNKVKSTIIGFIDGIGSLGCGLFQIFIPAITHQYGWHYMFYFLIGLISMSIICIICKCKKELCNVN